MKLVTIQEDVCSVSVICLSGTKIDLRVPEFSVILRG